MIKKKNINIFKDKLNQFDNKNDNKDIIKNDKKNKNNNFNILNKKIIIVGMIPYWHYIY